MRAYKCDRCGSYYDKRSEIGPYYGFVDSKEGYTYSGIFKETGTSTIKAKDLCPWCTEKLHMWFGADICDQPESEKIGEIVPIPKELESVTIEEMDLTSRSFNVLNRARYTTIGDIFKLSLDDLIKIRNLGKHTLQEIIEKMKSYGVTLNDEGKFIYTGNN